MEFYPNSFMYPWNMETFKPIVKTSRIAIVDVLRGFALFGVLLANVPYDHQAAMEHEYNQVFGFVYDMLINRKFITLFSILFGFGFHIQMNRAISKGLNFNSYFLRRMGLLFLIGCIHCFLIWNGDILMSYALGGVLLLLVRNWSIGRLTILAIALSVVLTGIIFIGNAVLGWQQHSYDSYYILKHPVANSYGEYLHINFRISQWVNFLQDMPLTLVFTFGNMLIGCILGKLKFFLNPSKQRQLTNRFIILGAMVGLPCSYLFHLVNINTLELDVSMVWLPFVVITGMILQTLGYMALFVKLAPIPLFKKLTSWFSYVGRTALSNYILQSILYLTVIFHAITPFGLYGNTPRGETYLIAAIFFIWQSFISFIWLKEYEQGPLEYLWKKMSYKGFVRGGKKIGVGKTE